MALDVYDYESDVSSQLSDAPSEFNDSHLERFTDADPHISSPSGSAGHGLSTPCKRSFSSFATDQDPSARVTTGRPTKAVRIILDEREFAPLEAAPAETLQMIAAFVKNDTDFANLQLGSRKLAYTLTPDDSSVWKARFLSRYDHPIVSGPADFCVAYKLRRLVLNVNNFVDFRECKDRRLQIQLETIKDMVLETYHNPKPWLPKPMISRNIACFSSPGTSQWLQAFLSSPFYDYGSRTYGRSNPLFDALQLTLSYLILSPASRMAHVVQAARDHYDLVGVYNWNQPFATLFKELPEVQRDQVEQVSEFKSAIFPNLRSPSPKPRAKKIKCDLDMYSLLHIRNFWHRHLIDMGNTYIVAAGTRENTYSSMAKDLRRLGHTPRPWRASLQDPDGNLGGIMNGDWYGHYSCLYPWPKKKSDLEEHQTCAEDWSEVSPLKLDFAATTTNDDAAWPPLFSTIPAFESTTPDPSTFPGKTFYIRGIARFLDLAAELQTATSPTPPHPPPPSSARKASSTSHTEYHPYLSNRIRGIIHPLPPQSGIPGWHRIIMVLFKPTTPYLIRVLEYADEDFGGPFGVTVTGQLQQTTIHAILSGQSDIDPVEQARHLKAYLDRKVKESSCVAPGMTRRKVEELEEGFQKAEFLSWDDIEYAYAYEGVVCPGGMVMLGRWWRCGEVGVGPGKEVDAQGASVEVGEGDEDEEESVRRARLGKGLERGPFCFWC